MLDQAAWASLTGAHAASGSLVERKGQAARYLGDVSPFHGLSTDAGDGGWTDLAALVGPGEVCTIAADTRKPPDDWETSFPSPACSWWTTAWRRHPNRRRSG